MCRQVDRVMKKGIRTIILVLLLAVFLFSVARLLLYYLEYRKEDARYETAAEYYIQELPAGESDIRIAGQGEAEVCPIAVDFEALAAESENVAGWLYCAGTNINYPVMQGEDNDYYLHHSYNGQESRGGAIFVDAGNRPHFADSNTIIYGHHMKNGSMFAHLSDWEDPAYFASHSEMWLLTPEHNYRVELLGGYLTPAVSDSYTIFTGACPEFDDYLRNVAAAFDIETEADMPVDGRYVMLSTCEYDYTDARYVLHGRLVPVEEEL